MSSGVAKTGSCQALVESESCQNFCKVITVASMIAILIISATALGAGQSSPLTPLQFHITLAGLAALPLLLLPLRYLPEKQILDSLKELHGENDADLEPDERVIQKLTNPHQAEVGRTLSLVYIVQALALIAIVTLNILAIYKIGIHSPAEIAKWTIITLAIGIFVKNTLMF